MFAPGIVIYEKGTRLESQLKRYFQPLEIQVRPCRLPSQVMSTLAMMPGSVTVIDLDADTAAGLRLITQVCQLVTPARAVLVVASRRLADLEWPAREFGAMAFLPATISQDELGGLCQRQLPSSSRRDNGHSSLTHSD